MPQISLAAARVNAKLTQEEVAKLINVCKSTIVSWENGKTYPRSDQLKKLCEIYKMPLDNICLS